MFRLPRSIVFSPAMMALTAVVGAGMLPSPATGATAVAVPAARERREVPSTVVTSNRPATTGAGRRHLERGDRALGEGKHRRARVQWVKALAAGGEVAAGARHRLRTLSDAREFPRWQHTTSEHFILHAAHRTPPTRDPQRFLARREDAYRRIVATLGIEPAGVITIYAYRSDRQALRLIGRTLGFARPAEREVHIRHDQEPGHEEAHVIAWHWNQAGSGVPFLEEGLAVAMSSHPGSPHASAADALAQDRLPSLSDLIARFRAYRNGYILAGSFVTDVLERHGADVLRQLYVADEENGFLPVLEAVTGESVAQLQGRWETVLAAQGSSNREELLEAIALQRMGRLDEAIALLETQREAQPDSAVVEFALAQAQRDQGDLEASTASFRRVLAKPLPHRLAWMQQRAREALIEMGGVRPALRPPER